MKHLFFLFSSILASLFVNSQEPCCTVIGLSPSTSSVTVRNNISGRLFMFRPNQKDMQSLKMGDAITTNASYTYVISINNNTVQYFVGPVNLTQNIITETTGLVKLNYGNPNGLVIYANNNEIIGFQNQVSGQTFHFKVPSGLGATIIPGEMIYTQHIDDKTYAIFNSYYQSAVAYVYAFPVDNEMAAAEMISTSKWTLTSIAENTNESGRLNTDFPDGVEWGIDIYTRPDQKLLRNRLTREKQSFFPMKPGTYFFKLNNVPISYVPIEQGKETGLKIGYLDIKSPGVYDVYDEYGSTLFYPINQRKKIALPAGRYEIKANGAFSPIEIKDKETTEI